MALRPTMLVAITAALTACASSDPGARDAARADDEGQQTDGQDASHRNVYSADIADDPYMQRQ